MKMCDYCSGHGRNFYLSCGLYGFTIAVLGVIR